MDDPGVLPYSDALPNDTPTNPNPPHNAVGQDNAYEGWYVDDVQIGFAEAGRDGHDARHRHQPLDDR